MLDSIAENAAVFLAYEWFVHYYPITPFLLIMIYILKIYYLLIWWLYRVWVLNSRNFFNNKLKEKESSDISVNNLYTNYQGVSLLRYGRRNNPETNDCEPTIYWFCSLVAEKRHMCSSCVTYLKIFP